MKRKPIIFITSILLLIGGYLFFKTNYKKKLEVDSSAMQTNTKIVIPDNSIDSIFRKYNIVSDKHESADFQSDKYIVEKLITSSPSPFKYELSSNFEYTPKDIKIGQVVSFKDLTKNAKSWEWRFGESKDMSVDSKEKNPSYIFKEGGLKTIVLFTNGDYKSIVKLRIYISRYPQSTVCGLPSNQMPGSCKLKKKLILNEDFLKRSLMGISQNVLSYKNFSKYFCKSNMPIVHLSDQRKISLKKLVESIQDKPIKINKANFMKDKDECITDLYIDYQLLK